MKLFRFHITLENNDELVRVLDLPEDRTFEDLYNAVLQSVGFDNSQLGSIYVCNDAWEKKVEITLIDMDADEGDLIPIMHDTALDEYIHGKGQKLVFEYDFVMMWRFMIEVQDILEGDKKTKYPRIVESVGDAPDQYESNDIFPSEVTDEDDELIKQLQKKNKDFFHHGEEEDDEFGDDEDVYDEDDFGHEEYGYDDHDDF
jgi:hypothetical protein